MKPLLHILFLLLAFTAGARPHTYDVVIVGGTPAGITAAVAAAREGKNSVILERSDHVGGLPVNGLGATDIATRGATAGLFARFVALNKAHYTEKYGAGSQQARDCSDGYHFEPSVAAETFARMLAEAGPGRITVLTGRQFDAEARYVEKRGDRIVSIRILDRATGREEHYRGAVFIDATYEGDLGAAAGVPFRTGREGAAEYGEPCAGKIYRWWKHGPDAEGTTYEGDDAIQAYNYRLCLTDNPQNRRAIPRPENYDREEYVSLVGDVLDGRNTDARYRTADSAAIARNRRRIEAGERTSAPGDVWGMAKVTSMTRLPNAKTDANNQHLALISTDLPEENQAWPTAGWAWRDRFAKRLRDYTLGLLWFAQHDEALPAHFREACLRWGLAADEYRDNGGFPRQVYVREGRRLEGCHFFTAQDALPEAEGKRPPLHREPLRPRLARRAQTRAGTHTPRRLFQPPHGGLHGSLRRDGSPAGRKPALPDSRFGQPRRILHAAHGALLDGPGRSRRNGGRTGGRQPPERPRNPRGLVAGAPAPPRSGAGLPAGPAPRRSRLRRRAAAGAAGLLPRMGGGARTSARRLHGAPVELARRARNNGRRHGHPAGVDSPDRND